MNHRGRHVSRGERIPDASPSLSVGFEYVWAKRRHLFKQPTDIKWSPKPDLHLTGVRGEAEAKVFYDARLVAGSSKQKQIDSQPRTKD